MADAKGIKPKKALTQLFQKVNDHVRTKPSEMPAQQGLLVLRRHVCRIRRIFLISQEAFFPDIVAQIAQIAVFHH